MANSIVSTLLGTNPFVIYNQSTKATTNLEVKVVNVSIKLSAEPQRQTMEDGSTKTDSKTVRPIRMTADVICPDINALTQVNSILSDRSSLYQITSRGLIFQNMMVDSEFIRQAPDMLSATPVRMSFKQILIENVSPIIFANQSDSSIIERGISALNKATETVTDLFGKVSTAISNI